MYCQRASSKWQIHVWTFYRAKEEFTSSVIKKNVKQGVSGNLKFCIRGCVALEPSAQPPF